MSAQTAKDFQTFLHVHRYQAILHAHQKMWQTAGFEDPSPLMEVEGFDLITNNLVLHLRDPYSPWVTRKTEVPTDPSELKPKRVIQRWARSRMQIQGKSAIRRLEDGSVNFDFQFGVTPEWFEDLTQSMEVLL